MFLLLILSIPARSMAPGMWQAFTNTCWVMNSSNKQNPNSLWTREPYLSPATLQLCNLG